MFNPCTISHNEQLMTAFAIAGDKYRVIVPDGTIHLVPKKGCEVLSAVPAKALRVYKGQLFMMGRSGKIISCKSGAPAWAKGVVAMFQQPSLVAQAEQAESGF